MPPDPVIADMAALLGEAVRHVDQALVHLGSDPTPRLPPRMTRSRPSRRLEGVYYRAMAALLEEREQE